MNNLFLRRRYLVSFSARQVPHIFTDVLIIGAGAAGLRAAIEAAAAGDVIVLSKGSPEESNTYYAQGGLASVLAEDDTIEAHVADTLSAGAGLADEATVRDCLAAVPEHIRQLQDWAMPFDAEGGQIELGREGGHTANRILHAQGDATGLALLETLSAQVASREAIKRFDTCFALDLLTEPAGGDEPQRCVGALTFHPRYGMQIIRARQVILAGGGAGMLWRETSNPPVSTGDAIAMAFRAGADLADLELMQFHPTVLYVAGSGRSLISEAVRGEGGLLVDRTGHRFMPDYHDMAELAPRDVVSRAILDRLVKTGTNKVYLDVRHLGGEFFARRFPSIDQKCRAFDIDPGQELIPVHPAAHYMIGGVRVDGVGQSFLAGLLACGEAACTGLHGANRLASNSLTEALVFGSRCGRHAGELLARDEGSIPHEPIRWTLERSNRTELDLADIRNSLRSVMWRNVGIVRDGQHLAETLEIIEFWGRYVLDKEFFNDPAGWEVQNMLTAGWLVANSALRREETRGVHYRTDFPDSSDAWIKHLTIGRDDDHLRTGQAPLSSP
jgi:L-aspartate oxidase